MRYPSCCLLILLATAVCGCLPYSHTTAFGPTRGYISYFREYKDFEVLSVVDDPKGLRLCKVRSDGKIWQRRELNDTMIEETTPTEISTFVKPPPTTCLPHIEYLHKPENERNKLCGINDVISCDPEICPKESMIRSLIPETRYCRFLPRNETIYTYCQKHGVADFLRFCCHIWRVNRCYPIVYWHHLEKTSYLVQSWSLYQDKLVSVNTEDDEPSRGYMDYFRSVEGFRVLSVTDDETGLRTLKYERNGTVWQWRYLNETVVEITGPGRNDTFVKPPPKVCPGLAEILSQPELEFHEDCAVNSASECDKHTCPRESGESLLIPEAHFCRFLPHGKTIFTYCEKHGILDPTRFCCHLWRINYCYPIRYNETIELYYPWTLYV